MKSRRLTSLRLEYLESRETPAILVSPTTVSYQDIDGDNVTVAISKPILNAGNVATVFVFDNGFSTSGAQQLQAIDLSTFGVDAANLSIAHTAQRTATNGDGLATVGHIL